MFRGKKSQRRLNVREGKASDETRALFAFGHDTSERQDGRTLTNLVHEAATPRVTADEDGEAVHDLAPRRLDGARARLSVGLESACGDSLRARRLRT